MFQGVLATDLPGYFQKAPAEDVNDPSIIDLATYTYFNDPLSDQRLQVTFIYGKEDNFPDSIPFVREKMEKYIATMLEARPEMKVHSKRVDRVDGQLAYVTDLRKQETQDGQTYYFMQRSYAIRVSQQRAIAISITVLNTRPFHDTILPSDIARMQRTLKIDPSKAY